MKSFPLNAWYAAAYDVEVKHAPAGTHRLRPEARHVPAPRRQVARAGGRLLAPAAAAVQGTLLGDEVTCGYHGLVFNGDGRCTYMPSQKTLNPSACVRAFPVVERHRFVWVWPGDPALRRPGNDPRPALERRPGLGRRRQAHPREVRLPAGARQPHGPDARDLRARQQHRPAGRGRGALRRHPRPPHRHRDALDGGHRSAALLGRPAEARHRLRGPRRPLADHPLRSALHHRHRRRRGPGRQRRAARATARRASTASCSTPSRQRPTGPATTSGPSRATTAWANSA